MTENNMPITGDFDDPTDLEENLAKDIAWFDYYDKPHDTENYPSVHHYVNEWWEERYVPVVRWIRRNR